MRTFFMYVGAIMCAFWAVTVVGLLLAGVDAWFERRQVKREAVERLIAASKRRAA